MKLIKDFCSCLENEIHQVAQDYTINWEVGSFSQIQKFNQKTEHEYRIIINTLYDFFTPNTFRAFEKLESLIKYQLEYTFKENSELYIQCCIKTLQCILPLYSSIEFTPF